MKEFKLIFREEEDTSITVESSNTGFNATELLGLLELKQQDMIDQMNRPVNFIRKLIQPDGSTEEIVKK